MKASAGALERWAMEGGKLPRGDEREGRTVVVSKAETGDGHDEVGCEWGELRLSELKLRWE